MCSTNKRCNCGGRKINPVFDNRIDSQILNPNLHDTGYALTQPQLVRLGQGQPNVFSSALVAHPLFGKTAQAAMLAARKADDNDTF